MSIIVNPDGTIARIVWDNVPVGRYVTPEERQQINER